MKKIMIALIACAMGVAAQAASVTWSATGIRVPEDDPGLSVSGHAPYSKYMAYLIDQADFSGAITAANYRDAINAATASTALMRANTSSTNPYGKVAGVKFECPYEVGGGSYFTLIIDSLTPDQARNFVVSGPVSVTEGSSDNRVYFNFNTITPKDSGTGMGTGWTSAAVPEPTSAMLLLLGLAGLALKRRRT